jgi:tetratricopeptide (TPR) repeat protein
MKQLKQIGMIFILAFAFSGAIQAQDPSTLYTRAIFAWQTLGDIEQAISLFTQIATDKKSDRETAAKAWSGLVSCYLQDGRIKQAQTAYDELKNRYPEQTEIIAATPDPYSVNPIFRQAPFEDGEILHYKIKGLGVSDLLLVAESFKENARNGWKLRDIEANERLEIMSKSIAWINSQFDPYETQIKTLTTGSEAHVKFSPDQIKFQLNGQTQLLMRNKIVFPGLFDVFLLRFLILRDGSETNIPFVRLADKLFISEEKLQVVGRERIAVPAGTFDCFIIEPTGFRVLQGTRYKLRYWVSADKPFYVVQIESAFPSSSGFSKLYSISKIEKNRPVVFSNDKLGISLSAPPGWLVSSFDELNSNRVHIFDSIDKSQCFLEMERQTGGDDPRETLNLTVDKMIAENEVLASPEQRPKYSRYLVRKDSRENMEIAGAMVTSFIADIKVNVNSPTGFGGYTQVDYTQYAYIYYLATANKICRLYFETRPTDFDSMKPVFDSIAKSVRIQ